MIIWGTTGITSTKAKGEFYCPKCDGRAPYQRKSVRRFFTLYFIPLIPLDKAGEFIRCGKCRTDFNDNVLNQDPDKQAAALGTLVKVALLRVLADLVAADGFVQDSEIALMQEIFLEVTGHALEELEARQAADEAPKLTAGLEQLLAGLGPNLTNSGREMILSAALRIAGADGQVAPEESERIERFAAALGVTKAHLRGLEGELASEAN